MKRETQVIHCLDRSRLSWLRTELDEVEKWSPEERQQRIFKRSPDSLSTLIGRTKDTNPFAKVKRWDFRVISRLTGIEEIQFTLSLGNQDNSFVYWNDDATLLVFKGTDTLHIVSVAQSKDISAEHKRSSKLPTKNRMFFAKEFIGRSLFFIQGSGESSVVFECQIKLETNLMTGKCGGIDKVEVRRIRDVRGYKPAVYALSHRPKSSSDIVSKRNLIALTDNDGCCIIDCSDQSLVCKVKSLRDLTLTAANIRGVYLSPTFLQFCLVALQKSLLICAFYDISDIDNKEGSREMSEPMRIVEFEKSGLAQLVRYWTDEIVVFCGFQNGRKQHSYRVRFYDPKQDQYVRELFMGEDIGQRKSRYAFNLEVRYPSTVILSYDLWYLDVLIGKNVTFEHFGMIISNWIRMMEIDWFVWDLLNEIYQYI